jgi:hypothetical protein
MAELKIAFTDKKITPWGGMVLLKNMMDQISFRKVLSQCPDLPQRGSNRSHQISTIIEHFITSVWCGANRFIHTEIVRHDIPLTKIFGWQNIPSQDTIKRFFAKFSQARNQNVFNYLYSWYFNQLKFDNYTLDFDSSVFTRYGNQEGAKKGYNPAKRGRNSHHPLIAFVADCKMVANFWLRSGDAFTTSNCRAFMEETFSRLENKNVGLIRLDSGFYDKEVFNFIEEKGLNYIVAARLYRPLQKILYSNQTWLKIAEGVEVASRPYHSPLWQAPRRIVMVRQLINQRPKATGKQLRLFPDDFHRGYRYSCYVTNLTLPPAEVWRLYRHRAEAENHIKELKYDFGIDCFNMQNFFATEAAINFALFAFNLMSLFRQFIINSQTQQRLSTLRFKTFAVGAYLTREGNDVILKLSLALKRREWFTSLWNKSKAFSMPVNFSNA